MFRRFDFTLECFPIFQTSCCPVVVQCTIAFFIPLALGIFCDFDMFAILVPYRINT